MLGGTAAAPHKIITLPIMGGGKDQRAAAGGAAHDAGEPVRILFQGLGAVGSDGLLLGDADLHGVKFLTGDKGRVRSGHQDDIRVVVIPAGAAGGIPADQPGIDRVAENILHGPIFKGAAAMGAAAHVI